MFHARFSPFGIEHPILRLQHPTSTMKANLKGLRGIKGLLLMHGEKIGIVLVGLLALYFVYGSLSLPRLKDEHQATNLQTQITQTNNAVQQTEWPDPDSEHSDNVRHFREKDIAKTADPTVNAESYQIGGTGFRPVIPPTQRRTDPELLNAVDVRAIGGSGLFAFVDEEILRQQQLRQRALEEEKAKEAEKLAQEAQKEAEQGRQGRRGRNEQEQMQGVFDPEHPERRMVETTTRAAGVPLQGGERIERAYWAAVVAKVPVREQLKRYQDAFENSRGYNPTQDFPSYLGYYVQRAEVIRGKPLEWQDVGLYDAQQRSIAAQKPIAKVVGTKSVAKLYEIAQKEWPQSLEPVDPRYMDPNRVLALPLPPLVGRDWGADVTHPDIPLAINAPPPEEVALEEQTTDEQADPDDPASQFRGDPNMPTAGSQMGGYGARMGGYPGGGYPGAGYPGGEMGGRGGYGPEMMMGPIGGAQMLGPTGQPGTLPRGVDDWLLRFFDYTVQPGKKYKYRVKLVIADPNAMHPDSTLDVAVQDRLRASKRQIFREVADWSEPSPTVGIPMAGSVQLADVKLPSTKSFNDEAVVKLMVETFDVDAEGAAVHIAKEDDYRRGYVVNFKDRLEYAGGGDRWIDTFEEAYAVNTGVTLLDVAGGKDLSRDYKAPARVLLMDPSGELSIRKELDDSTSVEYLRMLFSKDKKRVGDEGMMPGMPFMGPGGMPFGGPR
jgi:hypothetical protein